MRRSIDHAMGVLHYGLVILKDRRQASLQEPPTLYDRVHGRGVKDLRWTGPNGEVKIIKASR